MDGIISSLLFQFSTIPYYAVSDKYNWPAPARPSDQYLLVVAFFDSEILQVVKQ
jgi:hypothetical protein